MNSKQIEILGELKKGYIGGIDAMHAFEAAGDNMKRLPPVNGKTPLKYHPGTRKYTQSERMRARKDAILKILKANGPTQCKVITLNFDETPDTIFNTLRSMKRDGEVIKQPIKRSLVLWKCAK